MLLLREGEETIPRGCMARAPHDFAAVPSTLAAAVSALWGQRAGNPQSGKYTSPLQKYVHATPDTTRLHKEPTHPSRHQQSSPIILHPPQQASGTALSRHGTNLKLARATHRPCWVPVVFLRSGAVHQPSWQRADGSNRQLLLPALVSSCPEGQPLTQMRAAKKHREQSPCRHAPCVRPPREGS